MFAMLKTLHETTLELIEGSDLTYTQIATGAGVRERWLYALAAGRFKDPGVNKMERVYRFLSTRAVA